MRLVAAVLDGTVLESLLCSHPSSHFFPDNNSFPLVGMLGAGAGTKIIREDFDTHTKGEPRSQRSFCAMLGSLDFILEKQ